MWWSHSMFLIILGIALFNLALGYGLALFLHGRNGPFADWQFPLLGMKQSAAPAESATMNVSAPASSTKPTDPPAHDGATADTELVEAGK
jgi:hypothetical protein